MKKTLFLLFALFFSAAVVARTFSGKVIDGDGKPLEAVSVVVVDSASKTLAFGYTKADGSFSIMAKEGAVRISFSMMGFEKQVLAVSEFKNGQTVLLKSRDFVLKEVKVRADKITQTEDTLEYNVAAFQQGQDRSIADVIKKMPGLEVAENGQISFEGKPINKFYIEGMDLMGSKYVQASENLHAKKVKKVQVMQNHQPIKSLRGVQFSEQAALNIVLKDEAKDTWAKTADVGIGEMDRGCLYDGRLMAMMFSKKHQNLSMYKVNNAGKDIVHEVADLASLLKERQEMSGLLRNITVSSPDLDDKRTNFNTSHTVAMNELMRTRLGNDVRVQADWLWNRQRGELYNETEYTDLGGILLSENTSVASINNQLKLNLKYLVNKDRIYLSNQLHGYMDFDRSFGTTVLNGVETRQNVRPRKRFLTEDFEAMKTLRNGNILNFASQTTYNDLPGQLLTVLGETERLNLSGIESRSTVSLRQRFKPLTVKYEAGFSFKNQKMAVETIEDSKHVETNSQQNIFLIPSLNFESKYLKINASLKADLLTASTLMRPRFTFQPRIVTKYDINGTSALQTIYSYTETPNSLTSLFSTPVFTSYRTKTCHSGRFEYSGAHTANLSYNYKQPVRGNFLSLEGTWTRRTNNILYRSELADNVYLRTPTAHHYDADSYTIRAHTAKTLYWGKTTVSLTATQNWSNYALLIADRVTDRQMQNTTVRFKLAMTPARIFSYELCSELDCSRQVQLSEGEGRVGALTYFNHSLGFFFFPHKNWEIALKNEIYHSNDNTVNTTFFADAHVSYKQKRYELRLTAGNLFGKDKFERRTIGTTTNLYSVYKLRPREVLLSLSVDL